MAAAVNGLLEIQTLRMLRRLAAELQSRGTSVARWGRASRVDRSYLYRILGRSRRATPSIQTVDALLDGAWICLGEEVEVRLDLRLGREPICLEPARRPVK